MTKLRAASLAITIAMSAVLLIAPAAFGTSSKGVPEGGACLPNYDPCVEPAIDVDCKDGGGDGPVFVEGPLTVNGPDVYGLDGDGDGIACPPKPAAAEPVKTQAIVVVVPAAAAASPIVGAPRFTG